MKEYTEYENPIDVAIINLNDTGETFLAQALGKIIWPYEDNPDRVHIEILVKKSDGSGLVVNARYVHPR